MLNYLWSILYKIYNSTQVIFFKFLAAIFAFFAPIKLILLLVGCFIALDTGFGVWAAKKQNFKLTSRRFSAIISKMLVYQLAVLSLYGLETIVLGDFIKLFTDIPHVTTKLGAAVLVSVEVYSIDEKLKNVNGADRGLYFYVKRFLNISKTLKQEVQDLTQKNV